MIIERTEAPGWTSNAYLVADQAGGHAVLIDGNGVTEPLIEAAQNLGVSVDAILITHWHQDHIAGIGAYRERFGVSGLADGWTKDAIADDVEVNKDVRRRRRARVRRPADQGPSTPGPHGGRWCRCSSTAPTWFTADVLFKGTVGGTFAPATTGYADHKRVGGACSN